MINTILKQFQIIRNNWESNEEFLNRVGEFVEVSEQMTDKETNLRYKFVSVQYLNTTTSIDAAVVIFKLVE